MSLATAPVTASPPKPPAAPAKVAKSGRIKEVVVTFVTVLTAYWLYALVVVPLIEPTLEERQPAAAVSEEQITIARDAVQARRSEVGKYFPADAWEVQNPAVWQKDEMRLLFKTITPKRNAVVELKPCTVMYFPKPGANDAQPPEPIIMRATQGAIVQFDQPEVPIGSISDLATRQVLGGRLQGPIRIFRHESRPGAADDLEISTRDVEMLKDRVWTPAPVRFRLGRNHGSGRELEIFLASAEGDSPQGQLASTLRSLQLKRDVQMRLELATATQDPQRPPNDKPEPPIEIKCQGHFEFDATKFAASFHDRVDVLRLNVSGSSDQMNCEVLTVFFNQRQPRPAQSPDQAAAGEAIRALPVRLLQARGNPVTIRSPAQNLFARCRGLDYAPGATRDEPGTLVALGPGVLQGSLPDDPAAKYDAQWEREFSFLPDGAMQRASLIGAATIRFAQMGTIKADEIMAWLSRKPAENAPAAPGAPPARESWQLERVLAQAFAGGPQPSGGPVTIDSPQLRGTTGRLEAVVARPTADSLASSAQQPLQSGRNNSQGRRPMARANNGKPQQQFDVRGRAIAIGLVPEGEQLALSTVTIEQGARLAQLAPLKPGEKPLVVEGERLHVADANTEATRVTISGSPGHLEAAGMALEGATIELEKSANRLWIDGPGRMTMPLEQDLNGQPLTRPQVVTVTWKERMDFRSQTVIFLRDVLAQSEQQYLATDKLEAVLSQPIDFGNANAPTSGNPADRIDLAMVRCYGPATLEGRQIDPRGEQTSFSQIKALNLAVDRTTGAITASGPGTVTHVARGSGEALAPGAMFAPGGQLTAAPPKSDGLTYLNIEFRKFIDGNLNRRMIRFGDKTTTVYGPVPEWNARLDSHDLAGLGPRGMILSAHELEVREIALPRADVKRGWFELEARGDVVAEGEKFTARGDHLIYSEQKDNLVLRGNELSKAEIFSENPNGRRHESRANELVYWFKLQRALVNGAQLLDLGFPAMKQPNKPAK